MDQYLNVASNHTLEHKQGVMRTLMHKAESIVGDSRTLKDVKEHVRNVLVMNDYAVWILDS